jgi:hypothetical protein
MSFPPDHRQAIWPSRRERAIEGNKEGQCSPQMPTTGLRDFRFDDGPLQFCRSRGSFSKRTEINAFRIW